MSKHFTLENISAYKISFDFSNHIWNIVIKWDSFAKNTIGSQWIRATDSISANIAEGFGRRTKVDKIRFYRYSQSSLYECIDWFNKAKTRKLLPDNEILHLTKVITELPIELNQLIKFTNEKLKF